MILEFVVINRMDALVQIAFWPEQIIGSKFDLSLSGPLYRVTLILGVSLVLLKFLKKGFDTNVLWIDGDADADPMGGVINLVKALAVAICFPTIYSVLAGVAEALISKMLQTIDLSSAYSITSIGAELPNTVITLIFWIIYFVFYIQYLMRGVEIFILRMGVPLACTGLIDSDQGIWRTYWNKFLQSTVTVVVQMFLVAAGLWLAYAASFPLWGLAFMLMAVKTPRFIGDFLVAPASTNFNAAMHNTQMAVRGGQAFRKLVTMKG